MSETASLSQESISSTETYEAIGYTLEQLELKEKAWLEYGECPGPEVIGSIQIDEDSMMSLENFLQGINGFNVTEEIDGILSEDYDISEAAARRAGYSEPIDPNVKKILREIVGSFRELIIMDTDSSDNSLDRLNVNMFLGIHDEVEEEVHIDSSLDMTGSHVRYAMTLVGPGTVFYKGTEFGPEYFDEEGEFGAIEIPKTVQPVVADSGAVQRFLGHGDPHTVPTSNGPVPRLFLSATVIVK